MKREKLKLIQEINLLIGLHKNIIEHIKREDISLLFMCKIDKLKKMCIICSTSLEVECVKSETSYVLRGKCIITISSEISQLSIGNGTAG